jgi:hypothetical protein
MTEYQVLRFFPGWREAVRAAGLSPNATNIPLAPEVLLEDWGELVRKLRRIPTRETYRRDGTYFPSGIEKKLGPWSGIPASFAHLPTESRNGRMSYRSFLLQYRQRSTRLAFDRNLRIRPAHQDQLIGTLGLAIGRRMATPSIFAACAMSL